MRQKKIQLLEMEMGRYRCGILGIAKVRWTRSGEMSESAVAYWCPVFPAL